MSQAPPPAPFDTGVYARARRHAWMMLVNVFFGVAFVVMVDRLIDRPGIAFAVVVVTLIALNSRVMSYNCPRCGSNLFFRNWFTLPWPNKVCSRCGLPLKAPD